ncbi:hypothetical protein ACRRTK_000237 [Alexandromys fortis]
MALFLCWGDKDCGSVFGTTLLICGYHIPRAPDFCCSELLTDLLRGVSPPPPSNGQEEAESKEGMGAVRM